MTIDEVIALLHGLHLHECADVIEREIKRRDAIQDRNRETFESLQRRAAELRDDNARLRAQLFAVRNRPDPAEEAASRFRDLMRNVGTTNRDEEAG